MDKLQTSALTSAEQVHRKSVSRRAFSREGDHVVIDLRLAYIADGANKCSLRADPPCAMTGLCLGHYAEY